MAKNSVKMTSADDLNAEDAGEKAAVPVENLNGEQAIFPDSEEAEGPEYVVLKGNCVRHDGKEYRENSTIPVKGEDAERLLCAGVIAEADILRQRALAAQSAVSVTSG